MWSKLNSHSPDIPVFSDGKCQRKQIVILHVTAYWLHRWRTWQTGSIIMRYKMFGVLKHSKAIYFIWYQGQSTNDSLIYAWRKGKKQFLWCSCYMPCVLYVFTLVVHKGDMIFHMRFKTRGIRWSTFNVKRYIVNVYNWKNPIVCLGSRWNLVQNTQHFRNKG